MTKEKKNTKLSMYVFTAIGLAIMAIFWFVTPLAPITPMGMKIAGIFLGMIWLWSTTETIWPSILGLTLLGLTGFDGEGYAGIKAVWANAMGMDTVLIVIFGLVLFGAIEYFGVTRYISRWFVTRKFIDGRPLVFCFMFFYGCYWLSALTSPIISLLIVLSIAKELLESFGVERHEKFWPLFFIGSFLGTTSGHPLLPFKGAQLVVLSAYTKIFGEAMEYGPWIAFNLIMGFCVITLSVLMMKYLFRADFTKLENVSSDFFDAHPMPPMTAHQKAILLSLFLYVFLVLAPGFLPKTLPGVSFLNTLGILGITTLFVVVESVIRIDGKPMLPFPAIAKTQMNWGVIFMVAAAVYTANMLVKPETGVNDFLLITLDPILGGRSPIVFGAILFIVGFILTNFANNAAMAVMLMPVIFAFSGQMGVSGAPFAACVGTIVFFSAMLTPAASPHAGMLHGQKDKITSHDIYKYGGVAIAMVLISYITYGLALALANILF